MVPDMYVRIVTLAAVVATLLAADGVAAVSPGIGSAPPRRAYAQADAGYLADVEDCKISITYSSADDRTDVSLALAPPGSGGDPGVTLIFRAGFRGRTVDPGRLTDIVVRAHYRVHANERSRSAHALTDSIGLRMNLDPQDRSHITLAFFPTNWGYGGFAAAGDEIPVAYFGVTPADMRALALAKVVTGEVLWADFTLSRDELDALRAFTRQVLPVVAGR